jgi:hypothetical protein
MRPARGPLAGEPFAVAETGRGIAEHQFDMRSPIVGRKGSSMRIRKGSVGSFAQPEHRERDSAALDIWRWGRARSTSSTRNWLSRRQIHRFLPHDDTFRGEDDPSPSKWSFLRIAQMRPSIPLVASSTSTVQVAFEENP